MNSDERDQRRHEDSLAAAVQPKPLAAWRDFAATQRTCWCGREFSITRGEKRFAEAVGLPLPTMCKAHRLTRRQAVEAARRGEVAS